MTRLRALLRPWCRLVGHRNAAWMLPEEDYGLYAYERLYCSRCDLTFEVRTPEQIAAAYHFWERA